MPLSQIWTLRFGSVEKTLADWGIDSCVITRRTQQADLCEIHLANARFDDPEIFSFQSAITLLRNGAPWFAGVATKTPRMGRPQSEGVAYTFAGPWWFLDHIAYQQVWSIYSSGGLTPSPTVISNLILAMDETGVLVTTGAQITDALNCAIAAGAPLQIGTIDCAIYVPSEAARDLTCAEVIRRMLRWHPDCVTWVDYSTSPPTINVRARANLAAAAFSVAGQPAASLDVAARPDLVPPVVVLMYQQTNTVNDQQQIVLEVDQYPADVSASQPGALVMTVDLLGEKESYMRQYIKATLIDANEVSWWQDRLPRLLDPNIQNLALVDDSSSVTPVTSGEVVYNYALLQGELPAWAGVLSTPVVARALVNYDVAVYDSSGNFICTEQHRNVPISANLTSCNTATGWLSQLGSFEPAETAPSGLAQAYYTTLSQLPYEGSFELAESEVGTAGGPWLGRVLNLSGGLTEWSAMNALIFEVEENIGAGATRLRFGPAAYLKPQDWITLLSANRRRETGERYLRSQGLIVGGAHPVGGPGMRDSAGRSATTPSQTVLWVGPPPSPNPDNLPGANSITVQSTGVDPTSLPQNLTVRLREMQVCVSGVLQNVLVLCSEPYTPAGG